MLIDGDVGIGVFPEGEEILVGGASLVAGGGIVLGIEGIGAGQAEARASTPGEITDDSVVVDELPELRCRGTACGAERRRLIAKPIPEWRK